MKNKGFTLVELITVIVLLGVIAGIVVPRITNSIQGSEEELASVQIKNIEEAAKSWAADNIFSAPKKGETVVITLGMLKEGGYIADDVINLKTKEKYPDDLIIKIIADEETGELIFEISVNDESEFDPNAPELVLNGPSIVYFEVHEQNYYEYADLEQGIKAYDKNGDLIPEEEVVITYEEKVNNSYESVTSISLQKLGEYRVTYSVTDDGLTSKIYRTVIVRDTTKPEIVINPEPTTVCRSSDFTINLSATDNLDVSSFLWCQTKGKGQSCTPTTIGSYESTDVTINTDSDYHVICVQATDSSGNSRKICTNDSGSYYSLDKSGPAMSTSLNPINPTGSNNWYKTSPKVNVVGNSSGCSTYTGFRYQLSIDGTYGSLSSAIQTNTNQLNTEIASNECKTLKYKIAGYDSNNNVSTIETNEFKFDKTPPTIDLVASVEAYLNDASFTLPDATVSDNCTETVTVTKTATDLNLQVIGDYTVTYTATDSAGNTSTAKLTVKVRQIYANQLEYSNTNYTTCTESQCAIDELFEALKE